MKESMIENWIDTQKAHEEKIVYYLSMEFLMKKAYFNHQIHLASNEEIAELMEEWDIGAFYPKEKKETDIGEIFLKEEEKWDAALENGCFPTCFTHSFAVMDSPAYVCGIRYRHDLFRQKMENGHQKELSDAWLKNGKMYFRYYKYESVLAVPYDMPVVGCQNGMVNILRVWDARPMQGCDSASVNEEDYEKEGGNKSNANSIAEILDPKNHGATGKQSELKRQYFLVSASVQTAVKSYRKHHDSILGLSDKVRFQSKDTNSAVVIGELMRILLDEYAFQRIGWKSRFSHCGACHKMFFYLHTSMTWRNTFDTVNIFC